MINKLVCLLQKMTRGIMNIYNCFKTNLKKVYSSCYKSQIFHMVMVLDWSIFHLGFNMFLQTFRTYFALVPGFIGFILILQGFVMGYMSQLCFILAFIVLLKISYWFYIICFTGLTGFYGGLTWVLVFFLPCFI